MASGVVENLSTNSCYRCAHCDAHGNARENVNIFRQLRSSFDLQMPSRCCVPGWDNQMGEHTFPTNPEMSEKWRVAIQRVDDLLTSNCVCIVPFDKWFLCLFPCHQIYLPTRSDVGNTPIGRQYHFCTRTPVVDWRQIPDLYSLSQIKLLGEINGFYQSIYTNSMAMLIERNRQSFLLSYVSSWKGMWCFLFPSPAFPPPPSNVSILPPSRSSFHISVCLCYSLLFFNFFLNQRN